MLYAFLFTLDTVHRVLVGYPPGLPKDAAYDYRQIGDYHQQIYNPTERNLLGKLLHPDTVDIPRCKSSENNCRQCYDKHVFGKQFQDRGRFRTVDLADGISLPRRRTSSAVYPISPISMTKNIVTAAISVALRNTRTLL